MLTVVGKDRPGIVAGLTDVLFKVGANLGEASMARLGGNFTVMLMVSTDKADSNALRAALSSLTQSMQLTLHVDAIEGKLHQHVEPNVRVTVHGADRPGIVAQVTAALAAVDCNVLDLESDVGGTDLKPIYVMTIEGHGARPFAQIETALNALRQTGIEVHVSPIETLVG
jgi:glycine cleavage system transcriptional repressor